MILSSTLTCDKYELYGKLYASKYHFRHYTIRKYKDNPLHIEEYSLCSLPLTENIKHLKLNYYLKDSISH